MDKEKETLLEIIQQHRAGFDAIDVLVKTLLANSTDTDKAKMGPCFRAIQSICNMALVVSNNCQELMVIKTNKENK